MSESTQSLDEAIRALRTAALRRLARIRHWEVSDTDLRDLVDRHTDDDVVAQLRARPRPQPPPAESVVAEGETTPSRWWFWPWRRRRRALG